MTFTLEGDREMRAALDHAAELMRAAAEAAAYAEALLVYDNMLPRIPVRGGALKASAFVTRPAHMGGEIVVVVGVGTDHAVEVHERTEVHHPVGEAKFLERALNARAPGMGARLAHSIAADVEGGRASPVVARAPTTPREGGSSSARSRAGAGRRRAPGRGRGR